jgi:hypothetical protein
VHLFVSYLRKKESLQLRAEWPGRLGGIGNILDDGAKLTSQIFVKVINQGLFIHD